MGLLDHLWDDTVAGPRPDTGLGKLRKHPTFSFPSNSAANEVENNMGGGDATRVTRSIMVIKPPHATQKDSPPVSPAGTTPPVSPFGGGGRFKRRSSFSFEKASGVGPKSPPPPYDL